MKEEEVKDKYPEASLHKIDKNRIYLYQDKWNIFLTCIISN